MGLQRGDEEVSVQATAVEEEEVAMAIVAMVPKRDLLTDPERRLQIQIILRETATMIIMVLEDQGAFVAEEDTGVGGATTDAEDLPLPQEHQAGLI